jgi:broad specificity phosphatase PhoE
MILMRHADIDFTVFHSDLDAIPLTENGVKRVTKLAHSKNFASYDLVYTSPAKRAYDTAKVFSAKIGKEPIVKACLNERVTVPYWTDPNYWNRIEAMTWADFSMALEGGESLDDARKRIVNCMNEIVNVSVGRTVLIISHATVLCLLLSSLTERAPSRILREKIGFASYAVARHEDGKFYVDSWFKQ